eukprot:snap_masked-scaffold_11-processed-gene-4.18-mRNA-1 protein AED:0.28 eAED:0.28 QI:0/-1/0/1/-1/1/1/0/995
MTELNTDGKYILDPETEADGESYCFDPRNPKVPVFQPNYAKFKVGLAAYCEKYIENDEVKKAGFVKIIPPKEWIWNQKIKELDNIISKQADIKPLKQHLSGSRGLFRLDLVDAKPMSVDEFRKISKKTEPEEMSFEKLESKYWKSLSPNSEPAFYGSDNEGSLFKRFKLDGWNLNNLRSILFYGFNNALIDKTKITHRKSKDVFSFLNKGSQRGSGKRSLKRNKKYAVKEEDGDTEVEVSEILENVMRDCEKENLDQESDDQVSDEDILVFEKGLEKLNKSELYFADQQVTSLPGITSSMLYYGMWKTAFAWHAEDMDLFSANYLHYGAPKIWNVVPAISHKKFQSYCENSTFFVEDSQKCPEFLRHKTSLVKPSVLKKAGIHTIRCKQEVGQFVITFPRTYHSGFNAGFNVAEAANFATKYWLPYGRRAGWCNCEDFSVKFSMDRFYQNLRTHKPQSASKQPTQGDLLLVKWSSVPGVHLTRFKALAKGENESASRGRPKRQSGIKLETKIVVTMCSSQAADHLSTLKTKKSNEWVVNPHQDEVVFPTNKQKAWPEPGDRIFVTIAGKECFATVHKKDRVVSTIHETNFNNFEALLEAWNKRQIRNKTFDNEVNFKVKDVLEEILSWLEDQSTEKLAETSEEEVAGPQPTEEVVVLEKISKVSLREKAFLPVGEELLVKAEDFEVGYFSFDLLSAQWRWPDKAEVKLHRRTERKTSSGGTEIQGKRNGSAPVGTRKRAKRGQKKKIRTSKEVVQTEHVQKNDTIPTPDATTPIQPSYEQQQYPHMNGMYLTGENLRKAIEVSVWQELSVHLQKYSSSVQAGDIIIIKWAGWEGEYMVRVTEKENGGFCVVSTIDDPRFGSWDFDPTVDEWKRPSQQDLQVLLQHRADQLYKHQMEQYQLQGLNGQFHGYAHPQYSTGVTSGLSQQTGYGQMYSNMGNYGQQQIGFHQHSLQQTGMKPDSGASGMNALSAVATQMYQYPNTYQYQKTNGTEYTRR